MNTTTKKFTIILFVSLAMTNIMLTSCLGGRVSAPRDTIQVSKIISTTLSRTGSNMPTAVLSQDLPIIYQAIEEVYKNHEKLKSRRDIIVYKYNDITRQYHKPSKIVEHSNNPRIAYSDKAKTAIVSSRRGKDRKSLVIAYVDPENPAGIELKIGLYSAYRVDQIDAKVLLEAIETKAIELSGENPIAEPIAE